MLGAVLEVLGGGSAELLDRAGRAWGRAHRSVSAMVGRLSSLREALSDQVEDLLTMHRALDRVTAAATEEVLSRFERASRTDALTGVGNRRAFEETLSASLSAASRQGHEVTVVAVDLDGLKRVNDTEGHAAGDAALLALVRAFSLAGRGEDTVFRVGGDEFVVVLPFTSVEAARLLMDRVEQSGAPPFTWGAAAYPGDALDAAGVLDVADQNLYRRRQDRRRSWTVLPGGAAAGATRGVGAPTAGIFRFRPSWGWAWVPAAAVLVASLVATLVSATSPRPAVSASGHGRPPVASSRGPAGVSAASSVPPASAASGGTSDGDATLANRYVAGPGPGPASPAAPAGAPSAGESPSPSPSGSTAPAGGGIVGTLASDLSSVPLVGGSDGLIAEVGELLTGGSPSTVSARPSGASSGSP